MRERDYMTEEINLQLSEDSPEVVLLPTVGAPIWGCEVSRCSSWSGTRRWKLGARSRCRDVGGDGKAKQRRVGQAARRRRDGRRSTAAAGGSEYVSTGRKEGSGCFFEREKGFGWEGRVRQSAQRNIKKTKKNLFANFNTK
jgi:hypothetical protein